MITQVEFSLKAREKGIHLITEEIMAHLPVLPETGLLHLFLKHTSAALTLNENADPDVRQDLEAVFARLVREREPYYRHISEGSDDMPAHAKAVLTGVELTLPCCQEILSDISIHNYSFLRCFYLFPPIVHTRLMPAWVGPQKFFVRLQSL